MTTPTAKCRTDLFGGSKPWSPTDWKATDDRVRGGKSQSYFDCAPFEPTARFYGNLDIETLGGAGFASQRTTGNDREWNLDGHDGIEIDVVGAIEAEKRYAFTIKDTLLPPDLKTGREQSAISYEFDFAIKQKDIKNDSKMVRVPFTKLTATYRGREQKDAPALNTSSVKRIGLMMRSFFGDQDGHFSLEIRSIAAYKDDEDSDSLGAAHSSSLQYAYKDEPSWRDTRDMDEKAAEEPRPNALSRLFEFCTDCIRRR